MILGSVMFLAGVIVLGPLYIAHIIAFGRVYPTVLLLYVFEEIVQCKNHNHHLQLIISKQLYCRPRCRRTDNGRSHMGNCNEKPDFLTYFPW